MLAFGFAANTWGLGMGYSLFGAAVLLALFWVTWQRREGLTVV